MKRALATLALLTVLALTGYAQELLKADIPFDFVVNGKTLPAGVYEFMPLDQTGIIEVRSTDAKHAVFVRVLTRLAPNAAPLRDAAALTFDELNGKMFMETVWPVEGDGYLLTVTKQKHTHRKVKIG